MAPWAYCTQSAGLRHRVHGPRPQIQPYLRVMSLRCPNTASLMEGWHPEGSNPLAPPSCRVYPTVPTYIPLAQLVGRCLGTVLVGGVQKNGVTTPEKQVPSLGAPCSAFFRVSHPLSFRILVGLPWSWAFPLHVWPLPSQTVSSASRHSNPSLALCLAVVLTVYLVTSFLVAPLAQICAPVALSPLLPSLATSCAASGLGSAMWIPTQHPARGDSNVPLVIGRGAPFHSVTWYSHGTIAGTCAGGVLTGVGRPGLLLTTAGPWHSVHGTNEVLKNEVQVPYLGVHLRHLTFKGGQVLMLKLVTYQEHELPWSQSTPKGHFFPPTG